MKIILIIILASILNLVSSSCGIYEDCIDIWIDNTPYTSEWHIRNKCINNTLECTIRGRYVKPRCLKDRCCIFVTMDRYDTNPFLSNEDISKWLHKYFNPHFISKLPTKSECDVDEILELFSNIIQEYNLNKTDICVRRIDEKIGTYPHATLVRYIQTDCSGEPCF